MYIFYFIVCFPVTIKAIDRFVKENGFDPRKVDKINANTGLANLIQNILNTESNNKIEDVQDKLGTRIANANANNVPALGYFYSKMLEIMFDNPANVVGVLRLNESNTNNTSGPRAFSRITSMEVHNGVSQAPFIDPVTGKYYSAIGKAPKEIQERLVFNEQHPNFKTAMEAASKSISNWATLKAKKGQVVEQGDLEGEFNKRMYELLRYKGEHMLASALLNYEVTREMFKIAGQVQDGTISKKITY